MWILGPLLREASSSAPLLFSQWPPSCLACWFGRVGTPPPLLEASWIEVDGITLQDLDVSQIVWGY